MSVEELIDLLMDFPQQDPVYIPVGKFNVPVDNVVLTADGVVLDYFEEQE